MRTAWLCLALLAPATAQERPAPEAARQAAALLGAFCVDCHGADKPKAGLRLDTLKADFADPASYATWVKIHDRVKAGEMPPPKKSKPAASETDALLRWLGDGLHGAGQARQRAQGRTVLRRLNRTEYEHTLRDLLALPALEVAEMLPADPAAHGFDNVGEALSLSYIQMGRYLEAAAAALDAATVLAPRPETLKQRWLASTEGRLRVVEKNAEKVAIGEATGFLRQPNSAQAPWRWGKFSPAHPGFYRMRFRSFGFFWDKGQLKPADRPHVITVYASSGKGSTRRLWSFDVPPDRAGEAESTVWLNAGEGIITECSTLDDRTARDVMRHAGPGIAIEWMETEGPLLESWPPESHKRLFGELPLEAWTPETGLRTPGDRALDPKKVKKAGPPLHVVSKDAPRDAERLLKGFAERAFRRPLVPGEIDGYLELVRAELKAKACFQDAMRAGFEAVLCSPDFLFLREPTGTLDAWALAARLSYFLWSSTPDETLLSLARQGTLGEPAVLRAQVERMLQDAKARRFTENFLGQWLDLRNIDFTQPDKQLYPDFDTLLQDSMIKETQAYFEAMLARDLGADHVVRSDFAIVNGRLAELYGLPGITGVALREVKLPPGGPRGGFLTQASVLKITANGSTTSPVTRGAWVLDRLLGMPSPPPPPDIPAVEPDTRGTVTLRQQLDQHRNVPSCAMCHRKIDPPGFALESFDVMGGWRERYRTLENGEPVTVKPGERGVRYQWGLPVDASGTAPNGEAFKDVREFRAILLRDPERLARNLVERLLVYATGAGVEFADRREVEGILSRLKPRGWGLRSIVHEIAQSAAFRNK